MIPLGYMAKRIASRPDWLQAEGVQDIYSLSSCVSRDFCNYIPYCRHNGYWLFNSPQIIQRLCEENGIDLVGTCLFYYEAYEYEYDPDDGVWAAFQPEEGFVTDVLGISGAKLHGYDLVTFSFGNMAECSPLSCNSMAQSVAVNRHCLLESLEDAKEHLEAGTFRQCEPGPYRIVAAYTMGEGQPNGGG